MEIIINAPTPELKEAMENKIAEWTKQQDTFKRQQQKLDDEENVQ
jgi:hypothetical protein